MLSKTPSQYQRFQTEQSLKLNIQQKYQPENFDSILKPVQNNTVPFFSKTNDSKVNTDENTRSSFKSTTIDHSKIDSTYYSTTSVINNDQGSQSRMSYNLKLNLNHEMIKNYSSNTLDFQNVVARQSYIPPKDEPKRPSVFSRADTSRNSQILTDRQQTTTFETQKFQQITKNQSCSQLQNLPSQSIGAYKSYNLGVNLINIGGNERRQSLNDFLESFQPKSNVTKRNLDSSFKLMELQKSQFIQRQEEPKKQTTKIGQFDSFRFNAHRTDTNTLKEIENNQEKQTPMKLFEKYPMKVIPNVPKTDIKYKFENDENIEKNKFEDQNKRSFSEMKPKIHGYQPQYQTSNFLKGLKSNASQKIIELDKFGADFKERMLIIGKYNR